MMQQRELGAVTRRCACHVSSWRRVSCSCQGKGLSTRHPPDTLRLTRHLTRHSARHLTRHSARHLTRHFSRHASPEFQQVIADMGRLPYYSGECDVLTARVEILGCHSDRLGLGSLVCPPSSGTLLAESTPQELVKFQVDECQGVIGHITDRPAMPMSIVNRHFGEYEDKGHGEAKHTAIFGQNGSGAAGDGASDPFFR